MKKIVIGFFCSFAAIGLYAQEADSVDLEKNWTTKGDVSLLVNQSTFDNWLAGGENNFSGNIGLNYDINYKKEDWTWDNKIIASYGIVRTKTNAFSKKTDDRLELNSVLGKKAEGYWYYSAFLNFRTQFTKGYNYAKDSNGVETRDEFTNFLSPGYLSFGPGMLWKKSDNLKVNLSPLTSKIILVDKNFTLPDGKYFGVDEGKSIRYKLGLNVSGYYKLNLMENVSFENILNLYSNYLKDPQNIDIDYQLNIVMKINKYLSTNVAFQTIYDNNAFKGFQVRQVFGVGFNYAL